MQIKPNLAVTIPIKTIYAISSYSSQLTLSSTIVTHPAADCTYIPSSAGIKPDSDDPLRLLAAVTYAYSYN